jgi:hypothetical protein
MNDNDCTPVTWKSEKHKRRDLRRQKIRKIKESIKHVYFAVFWNFLNITHLNRPYSIMMCRLGLYKEYQKGICGWCGRKKN